MKVRLAKTAGFCMGVRRAMEMVLSAANKEDGPLFTYGPLIHNKQVLDLLESKNVRTIENIEEIKNLKKGTLLIRAHGIPPLQRRLLKDTPLKIIDATCPRVARVQAIIRYHTNKGSTAVIVGDRNHAEVIGLMGYSNNQAYVISSPSEVEGLPETDHLFVVAQTTQNLESYHEISEIIKARYPGAIIFDTICEATGERQREIKSLAAHVDGVVVVGGYHSANTRRLVQVSEGTGTPTFHIETEKELERDALSTMEVIGVTAGASTPHWMIKNVVKEIEAIRGRGETLIGRWIRNVSRFLLLSNFMAASGAFSLAYAAAILSGRRPDLFNPLLAFLYVYSMHVLNRFLDKGAGTYNDPDRASFYSKHKFFLIVSAIISIMGALVLSYRLGISIFLIMAGLSILGIIYSIPVVPVSIRHRWKYSKIKDIPGSKTISEAFAWAVIIALPPLLEPLGIGLGSVIILFLVVLLMSYIRSIFFDMFHVQGDLIVGVETLPITLGEKKTIIHLKWIIVIGSLLLVTAPFFRLVTLFSLLLLITFVTITLCLTAYENHRIYPGPCLEYLMEGNFLLAGVLGLIWQVLS
ncbi:MAG: 4-hydroxy-3-methylbut-2-enyl diphosphate reductase [Deltaproteobacteria bacterium]|nr:4-hydroxy-3-methylbut-2-enyl diphosphate reductase [Deltaproteobacteria bacterium]